MEFSRFTEVPNLHQLKQAQEQLEGVVYQTPLEYSHSLSERFGASIYLKREDLQKVRSYKLRGAYHKIVNLPTDLKAIGVVAASAGNHAQGVAYACASLKIMGTIFMPKTTPLQKIEAVRFFAKDYARIKLVGDTYDDAYKASLDFAIKHQAVFIHPFDDYDVIAGQASVGLELLNQMQPMPDFIISPFGGGGLSAGLGLVKKYLAPSIQLIAVEPEGAPSLSESLEANKVLELSVIDRFVDGASVKRIGDKTFEISKSQVNQVLKISVKSLCRTMLDLYQKEGILAEPAGALSVAALEELTSDIKGKQVVCIISGGNFAPKRFPEIGKLANLP